jgi:hypothetical protein
MEFGSSFIRGAMTINITTLLITTLNAYPDVFVFYAECQN